LAKIVGAAAMRSKALAAGAALVCAVAKAGTTRLTAVMEQWALMERVMSAGPVGITCWQSIQALTQGTRDRCFLFLHLLPQCCNEMYLMQRMAKVSQMEKSS